MRPIVVPFAPFRSECFLEGLQALQAFKEVVTVIGVRLYEARFQGADESLVYARHSLYIFKLRFPMLEPEVAPQDA
ncbi:MAG: hypothetical protein A3G81_19260 [Betaproteobacteria bacterium RIFCSPLOWO2_12_FULL_65_14]|nr:MAG: hypothetical protein A3G81_19260 [Betaproteobacteria bacterium RIFCSPLOWO2_12_FULL_65_14]